jgi:RNA polymerase sigma factor (sigma-70 family)
MFTYDEPLFSPQPFWFANTELLTQLLHAEIETLTQLLTKYRDLPNLLDAPEATIPQRSACFALLAHRQLIETIDETFTGRYEESPPLSELESDSLSRTHNLVAADAPAWVLEIYQVVEQLPAHIQASLPKPLRAGGYDHDNAEKMHATELAVETLSSTEQIQALTERVLDQQLQRLARRWSAAIPTTDSSLQSAVTKINRPKGFEGLGRKKADYSRYMDGLTDKQKQVFSLRYEYGRTVTEIASRLGIDRSTVYEHIDAIDKKVRQMASSEKRKSNRAKGGSDE